jgi:hypothetical protein
MTVRTNPPGTLGLGVDAQGGPVIDPTANVLSLVEAAVKRLDDLREAETVRHNDLRVMQDAHAALILRITTEFQQHLREAESKRIDAIRVVDVNAVSVATARAADQASVLAVQVQTSADALRSLVASANAEFSKRLAELERTKYEVAGRSTVTDPAMADLVSEMRKMREAGASSAGKSEGVGAAWVVLLGAVSLLSMLITIGAVLYGALKS